jgi:hypothetical protein
MLTGVADLEVPPDGNAPLDDASSRPSTDASVTAVPEHADAIVLVKTFSCPSFALFCDDFESGDLTKWTSLFQSNGGKVSVVDAPVFEGKHALRAFAPTSTPIDASNPPTIGAGARVGIAPLSSGMFAFRARVFMTSTLAPETTFVKVLAKNGVDDMNVKITVNGLLKEDTDIPDEGPELTASKVAPTNTWFCLEWQATIATTGHQRLILDGETVLDTNENNFSSLGYDQVQAGFEASKGSLTQEVLFDDVVIATQPIGPCP